MLEYIDSHAHYDDEAFDSDRDEVLVRVHEGGVKYIINMGCNMERSRFSVEYANKFPFIYAAVGIHPEDVDKAPADYLSQLRELAADPKVVAIGEIGLDYHYDGYDADLQKKIFEEQLDLAQELDLPVVIHSRDATEDTLNILRKRGKVNGVMHCFSGSAETAKQMLELGLHISFTGVLTFKNAKKAIGALGVVPMNKLLLETDCPYMAPEPNRGKRCDSSMIVHVIDKIAAEKGVVPEEVAQQTIENTVKLFYRIKL